MGDILIRSIGGTRDDPRSWPKSLRSGVVERAPCVFARNMTWAHGPPQGRDGQVSLYGPLGAAGLSTGCNGPVKLFHHVTRPGSEYIITAGYKFVLSGDGAGLVSLVVSVFADRQFIARQTFPLDAVLRREIPTLQPIFGFSFGAHFYLVGPGVSTGGASAVSFLELKFTRTGVTIAEADLFDRGIVSNGPGDDDGPFSSRVQGGVRAACVFQSRVVLAVEGGLIYCNIADIHAWPANNFVPIVGGDVGALGPTNRYLMVYLRQGTGDILRGGLTSVSDTSLDIVTGNPGCVSQEGLVITREGQIVLAEDGIYLCRPEAAPLRISGGVDRILRGEAQLHGFDASAYMPLRASFVNAPAGWLPQLRELHISLSTGAIGSYPWVDAGGHPIDGYGYANARDVTLVAHIPEGAYENPENLIEWSFDTGGSAASPRTAESMCCYTDADGFDVKLTSSHRGRALMCLVGDTDVVDDGEAVVKVNEPSATLEIAYGCTLALAPIVLPVPGRATVEKVDVGFVETRVVDDDATFTVEVALGAEDGFAGETQPVGLVGTGAAAAWGDALPMTMKLAARVHRAPGLQGAAGADAVSVRLESKDEPMMPVTGLVLRVRQTAGIG